MKNAILVSGAGSGIGRAIAKSISDLEHPVILLGRNRGHLEETLSQLKAHSDHSVITADIKDALSIKKGLEAVKPVLGGVVANAGMGGENHYGENDLWSEIIETNLTGTYRLVHESLPYFASKKEGFRHIVIISSILARLGIPAYSAYCASKAGLLGLMRSWATEFAHKKILVNAICPGWVDTKMATEGLEAFATATKGSYDQVRKEALDQVLLRKMSTPEEIAGIVEFLISEKQSSITGQSIDINNGALMPA